MAFRNKILKAVVGLLETVMIQKKHQRVYLYFHDSDEVLLFFAIFDGKSFSETRKHTATFGNINFCKNKLVEIRVYNGFFESLSSLKFR